MIADDADPWLKQAADTFGSPCFVYFADRIDQRIALLREAFGGRFCLSFAVKSNPNPGLLGWMNGRVDGLDISSIGELALAMHAGWNPGRVSFTGPAKREFEIRDALQLGVGELIVESLREAKLADRIAGSLGIVQDILVRIAPATVPKGFGDQMAGRPIAFGIDCECLDVELPQILELANLRVTGLHIFSGTQCLKPEAIVENYRLFLGIFRDVCGRYALAPEKLVFGSGLGVPYHDEDHPLDLAAVAADIGPDIDELRTNPLFADTRLILELGRYLVAEAGFFVTRVVSIKQSRGTRIAICDGGMNHHLPATGHFGMVMRRNYSMHKLGGGGPAEPVDLAGPLCTSIDRLAKNIALPRLHEGDLIIVHNSGAYGLTASPIHFISHAPPAEVMMTADGLHDVSRSYGELGTNGVAPENERQMLRLVRH